jgi:hypothetical protein
MMFALIVAVIAKIRMAIAPILTVLFPVFLLLAGSTGEICAQVAGKPARQAKRLVMVSSFLQDQPRQSAS